MAWRGDSRVRAGEGCQRGPAEPRGAAAERGCGRGLARGPAANKAAGEGGALCRPPRAPPPAAGPGCAPGRAVGAGARRHRPPTPGTPQVPVTGPDRDSSDSARCGAGRRKSQEGREGALTSLPFAAEARIPFTS